MWHLASTSRTRNGSAPHLQRRCPSWQQFQWQPGSRRMLTSQQRWHNKQQVQLPLNNNEKIYILILLSYSNDDAEQMMTMMVRSVRVSVPVNQWHLWSHHIFFASLTLRIRTSLTPYHSTSHRELDVAVGDLLISSGRIQV